MPIMQSRKHSIAGKIFIVGEYAVLGGHPAVVAAVGPRFSALTECAAESDAGSNTPTTDFAPASPVGRLLETHSSKSRFHFEDPWLGAGGFGASTAQFALVLRHLIPQADWKMAWTLYRKLMTSDKTIPSGADLVAQWQGGVQLFTPNGFSGDETTKDIFKSVDWSGLLVFSATQIKDRKVATHTHLEALTTRDFSELQYPLKATISAIEKGDAAGLGKGLTDYADSLARMKLESQDANADRVALSALPHVLGVKGAGALQSDAMIVLCDQAANRAMIIAVAESRGLKLVCSGLGYERGIQNE